MDKVYDIISTATEDTLHVRILRVTGPYRKNIPPGNFVLGLYNRVKTKTAEGNYAYLPKGQPKFVVGDHNHKPYLKLDHLLNDLLRFKIPDIINYKLQAKINQDEDMIKECNLQLNVISEAIKLAKEYLKEHGEPVPLRYYLN